MVLRYLAISSRKLLGGVAQILLFKNIPHIITITIQYMGNTYTCTVSIVYYIQQISHILTALQIMQICMYALLKWGAG